MREMIFYDGELLETGCGYIVVVVVTTSPLGAAYMGRQKCPEEMRNSTRL